MKFHVLTLFPEMIEQGFGTSITGKAVENGTISLNAVNIRDYTEDKHRKVDDYTYGGGAGMLIQAQPVYAACQAVKKSAGKETRVIYVTPQGRVFKQETAEELAKEKELIFLCGHYEGIDERVLEEVVTDYISIGDYVLTGGELPALVMMDAISRLVPEVLHNEESAQIESFHNHLLEYPQYSRPEVWREKTVPAVLLSGNHKEIEAWRLEQSVKRTKERRADLYPAYEKTVRLAEGLRRADKLLYMDMIEELREGRCQVLYAEKDGVLLSDKSCSVYLAAAKSEEAGYRMMSLLEGKKEEFKLVSHQLFLNRIAAEKFSFSHSTECNQAVYTRGVTIPADKQIEIRLLEEAYLSVIIERYHLMDDEEYIKDRMAAKCFYGAFVEGELAGFIGTHGEESMGMLEVFEPYRKRGVAYALEADCINRQLQAGKTPYCQIITGNEASMRLQEKLGLRVSKEKLWWLSV